jgi:hypothetical protein
MKCRYAALLTLGFLLHTWLPTAVVTNSPPAAHTEECVLDATGRSIAVYAEHRDGSALDLVLAGAVIFRKYVSVTAELLGWHGSYSISGEPEARRRPEGFARVH